MLLHFLTANSVILRSSNTENGKFEPRLSQIVLISFKRKSSAVASEAFLESGPSEAVLQSFHSTHIESFIDLNFEILKRSQIFALNRLQDHPKFLINISSRLMLL